MAIRWRAAAARTGEELRQTGRVVLHAPVLARGAECCMRFLLGAVLAGGELFGGYAPFGVGLVACSGSGTDGLCALLGALLGYLTFRDFVEGLRYAAACVLVFSVAFAFYDISICQKHWFMPVMAAGMDAMTGFVYLADSRWSPASVIVFLTEILLAGASAYYYQIVFSLWDRKEDGIPLTTRQGVSLLFLLGTALMALVGVQLFDAFSLGRTLAVVLVLAVARSGGTGCGAAAGLSAGLGMDLASGRPAFYAMAYGFSGLLTGAGRRQSRLFCTLAFVVSHAAAVLWTWEGEPRIDSLYEVFMASVCFMLLPKSMEQRLSAILMGEEKQDTAHRAADYVSRKLSDTAAAFRGLCRTMRASFPSGGSSSGDAARVFDRTAQRVCRSCPLRSSCWERDYVSTFNALNDALPTLLEHGRGEAEDFPKWFTNRCLRFPQFLKVTNEEVIGLLYRRQLQSRVRENRGAVCRQYETLSQVLTDAASQLSAELVADPLREKRLRQHLTGLGLEGEASVYYDEQGHLRAELSGDGLSALEEEDELGRLSALMGCSLRREGEQIPGRLTLLQEEPLMATAGLAARRKEGQRENGDTGTWFKRGDGSLFVLLCDGMGAGAAAHKESALAVQLLEDFLRAGVDTQAALRTVNGALSLRNEDSGAFTTVDLLRVDLFTGEGEVCKYGAAPSFVRKGRRVSRVTGSALPAGLVDGDSTGPDRTALNLEPGDWVVLFSDGVASPDDDQWVRQCLEGYTGDNPKELTAALMAESERRVGAGDDRTVVAVRINRRA